MSRWKFGLAGVLGQGLLGGLFATTRVERIGDEGWRELRARGQPVLFALWHGQLLPMVYYHQQEGVVVLVSEHADGEYVARVLHRYGFETVRGSSTRGGSRGLRGLVRAVRDGKDIAITPDGPKGPAQVVKPGALVAAQLTGAPIIPTAMGSDEAWSVNSWDGFQVPKPLTKLRLVYGDPIRVPRDADEETLERMAGELGETLNRLTAWANSGDAGAARDAEAPDDAPAGGEVRDDEGRAGPQGARDRAGGGGAPTGGEGGRG